MNDLQQHEQPKQTQNITISNATLSIQRHIGHQTTNQKRQPIKGAKCIQLEKPGKAAGQLDLNVIGATFMLLKSSA